MMCQTWGTMIFKHGSIVYGGSLSLQGVMELHSGLAGRLVFGVLALLIDSQTNYGYRIRSMGYGMQILGRFQVSEWPNGIDKCSPTSARYCSNDSWCTLQQPSLVMIASTIRRTAYMLA